MQNQSKIHQKTSKIEARAGLGAYQDVLVVSWGVLPPFGRVLRHLEASWGYLVASWGCLGAVLGPSWGARRPSLGRLEAILELYEATLGRLSACNGGKMRHSILYVVFDWFWMDFTSKVHSEIIELYWKNRIDRSISNGLRNFDLRC